MTSLFLLKVVGKTTDALIKHSMETRSLAGPEANVLILGIDFSRN